MIDRHETSIAEHEVDDQGAAIVSVKHEKCRELISLRWSAGHLTKQMMTNHQNNYLRSLDALRSFGRIWITFHKVYQFLQSTPLKI